MLQKEDIFWENIELFALILIKNQKFGSVRFGRTLGSEFGRTELSFDMCQTESNCSAEQFGKSSAEPNVRFTTTAAQFIYIDLH